MTAMHVYKRGFIPVKADDGSDFADLLGQALAADVTTVVVDVERSFADGGTNHLFGSSVFEYLHFINLNSRIHLTCHSEERSDEESPLSKGNLLQNGDSSLPLVAQNDMKRELSS
jgi:hypothetical protein